MKKLKIRYIIFIVVILILTFNDGNRTLVRRFFEQNRLKSDLKYAQYQNDLLKKRIYYLENEPSYLERMVRSELGVCLPTEIEYRFSSKD
ncbi:MAG: septum formation initiator family protein [Endomicrobium sp.]|jgi:cell division protein FtsB|nr:septum formation initiator family protein [Endomicrobium sp.]